MLLCALLIAVTTYAIVLRFAAPQVPGAPAATSDEQEDAPSPAPPAAPTGAEGAGAATASPPAAASTEPTPTLREALPLRDLPLTEGQRQLLEAAGIDVETYVVTPASVACAEAAIGAERLAAIVGGEAPSFAEGLALVRCI